MRQRPMAAAAVNPAVTQQEGKQLLAFAAKVVRRRLARPDKIAHRLMSRVRRPDAGQFAGPVQSRQRDRVAPVRLDPLARPLRDQGRSDHHAIMAESLNLSIKPVSRRPGFKADMQRSYRSANLLIVRSIGSGLFSTSPRNRTSPVRPAFRDRHGVLLLGDIKSDENFAILSHGPPSAHEARLGLPEQPSFLLHERAGHRLSPRT